MQRRPVEHNWLQLHLLANMHSRCRLHSLLSYQDQQRLVSPLLTELISWLNVRLGVVYALD